MANIVYDDASSIVSAGGSTWKTVTEPRYFDGSTLYPPNTCDDSGDTGEYATLTVSFQGTSLAMIGNSPYSKCSQWMEVSIDGGATNQVSYGDPNPQNTIQWYKSPTLSDGSHTISFSHISGTSLDYMVVGAGLTTPLSGLTLIVDDGDPGVNYSGSWSNPNGRYVTSDSSVEFYPYGNAVHRTSTVGSAMSFQFTGTSISVYSVFDYSTIGHMVVDYTVDGKTHSQPYTVSTSTSGYEEGIGHRGNTLLFSSTGLSAGSHTLEIEMTSNSGMALSLDYFLYTPSFDTLAALEGVNPATITPSTSSASATVSSPTGASSSSSPIGQSSSSLTGSNSNTQMDAQTSSGYSASKSSGSGTNPSFSNPTGSASSASSGTQGASNDQTNLNSSGSSPPLGAIIGAVLGSVFLILILLFVLVCRRRRRRSLSMHAIASEPYTSDSSTAARRSQSQDLLVVKPFLASTPSPGYPEDIKHPNPSLPTNPTPLSPYPTSFSADVNRGEGEVDSEQDLSSPTLSYATSGAFHGTSLVDVGPSPPFPSKTDVPNTSSIVYLIPPLTALEPSPSPASSRHTNEAPVTPAYLSVVTPLTAGSSLTPHPKDTGHAYLIPPLTAHDSSTIPLTPLRKQGNPESHVYLIPPLTAVDTTAASPLSPLLPQGKAGAPDTAGYLIPPLTAVDVSSSSPLTPRVASLSTKHKGDFGDSPAYLIPPLTAATLASPTLPSHRQSPLPAPNSHQGPSSSVPNHGPGQQERSSTAILRSRMQRLQDLVEELNFALADGQTSGAHVADLRRRIKELSRDDGEAVGLDWRASVTPAGVPPPYRR